LKSVNPINIPNFITLIRILLVPVFVIFMIKEKFFSGLIIFIVTGISDLLDGLIARKFDKKTVIGAYLDPVADKLLIMSSFVCLAVLDIIPKWLTVIVFSRDVLIVLGIAIFAIANISFVIKPSFVSKCNTFFQFLTISWSLFSLQISFYYFSYIAFVLIWITACLTVISGMHYAFIGIKILQATPENNNNKN
jgi:cardiolipin synthase (CMP-forming)